MVCALLFGAGTMPLPAQSNGTITGTVVDQAGKSVDGAKVAVKTATGSVAGDATADAEGHFTVNGLAAGTYTVDTVSPGFALNTRRDVPVTAGGSEALAITMYVDAISQSVTVQATVVLAADEAPQGNTLERLPLKPRSAAL
jgi:hypothetical protein